MTIMSSFCPCFMLHAILPEIRYFYYFSVEAASLIKFIMVTKEFN